MLNASNLLLITFSEVYSELDGQIFALFVMLVAASEVCVGLALVIAFYRNFYSLNSREACLLKG